MVLTEPFEGIWSDGKSIYCMKEEEVIGIAKLMVNVGIATYAMTGICDPESVKPECVGWYYVKLASDRSDKGN